MGLKPRAKKSENKTKPTTSSVASFIARIDNDRRRRDSLRMLYLMKEVSGEPAVMWGASVVGFGSYHYKYDSGREGDAPRGGFSPRKANMTVYVMPGFSTQQDLLAKLGTHKSSVSCLYITDLDKVDLGVLKEIVVRGLKEMDVRYPG